MRLRQILLTSSFFLSLCSTLQEAYERINAPYSTLKPMSASMWFVPYIIRRIFIQNWYNHFNTAHCLTHDSLPSAVA
jgi:hypothetical protein